MKTTLLFVLLALQSTAAFAATQVLNCKGIASDELGELKTPISVEVKIVHPDFRTLLVINGESGASERASIKIAGLPEIQVYGINVTNLRKSISISAYIKDRMNISAYIPVKFVGAEGVANIDLSMTNQNNVTMRSALTCDSSLVNHL